MICAELFENKTLRLGNSFRTVPIGQDDAEERPMTIRLTGFGAKEGSPAFEFRSAYIKSTEENLFNDRARIYGSVSIELSTKGDNAIHISNLKSHVRGSGSEALQFLCNLADHFHVKLDLHAMAYEDKSMTERLIKWYGKFGFEVVGDGNRNLGYKMVRTAR